MKALTSLAIVAITGLIAIAAQAIINHQSRPAPDQASSGRIGTVVKVADGDTLTVLIDGEKLKVRLCGIDAPEKAQALGKESGDYLRAMALNKQVAVTRIETDRFGRTVGEVFVLDGEKFTNEALVLAGLAYHYPQYSGKCPNRNSIIDAEGIAQSKRSGVWADSSAVKPWDYRKTR